MAFSTVISSIGVALILLAFLLSVFNLLLITSKWYLMLNIIGGVFACYGSALIESIPFTILEGTWSIVAITGLLKSFKKDIT